MTAAEELGLDPKWTDARLALHYYQYEPAVNRFVDFVFPNGFTKEGIVSVLKPHFKTFLEHDRKRHKDSPG